MATGNKMGPGQKVPADKNTAIKGTSQVGYGKGPGDSVDGATDASGSWASVGVYDDGSMSAGSKRHPGTSVDSPGGRNLKGFASSGPTSSPSNPAVTPPWSDRDGNPRPGIGGKAAD
jgi:hypothetical protein